VSGTCGTCAHAYRDDDGRGREMLRCGYKAGPDERARESPDGAAMTRPQDIMGRAVAIYPKGKARCGGQVTPPAWCLGWYKPKRQ